MMQGINTLMRYGVDGETVDVRRAALRGVANALLLDPKMRQVLVDTGYAGRLAERLKTDSSDDEMITSRIIFLTTYDTTLDFEVLINKHSLADNVNYVRSFSISHNSEFCPNKPSNSPDTRNNFPSQEGHLSPKWMNWVSLILSK
jgi:hypothetical protein